MKNLFKLFAVTILVFTFSKTDAQISVGAGLVYGTDISNIGFTLNGKYEFNEKWSAAPSFTIFLKKDYVNWSALDLDANYQIMEIENIGGLYAIGGINMTFFKIKYDDIYSGLPGLDNSVTGSEMGINLGVGIDIPVTEKITVAPELKYTIGGFNYLHIGAKALYTIK
ncbi:MAG: outer membrane beta-barrel protein [Bacteroidales bacterium]|nr:outer membrane beta-barrel protein [Bacteroidales bacterium]MCF8458297.1 outer membrane beta-barrel protein [Bacteroidales bacterium]